MKTTEPKFEAGESAAEIDPLTKSANASESEAPELLANDQDPNAAPELSAKFYYWVLSRL